jgi:type II secretory pathway component HofQ
MRYVAVVLLLAETCSNVSAQPPVNQPLGKWRTVHASGTVTDLIQQAFRPFAIDVVFVAPLRGFASPLRMDLSDANLESTVEVLSAMTHCFFVPINAHLVLAIQDDEEQHRKYDEIVTTMIDIPDMNGGSSQQKAEVTALLANLFPGSHSTVRGNTVTIHATKRDTVQIRDTLQHLFRPSSQVLLEIKAYLVSKTRNRNVGVQLPQQVTVFNIETEAESLISSNESAVEALVTAGVVDASDTLGIVVALIAEGYGANSVLSSPFVYFGGGSTATGVQFSSVNANLSLNTSVSQQLQTAELHLLNDQVGTMKIGERYPVMTSSTVSLGASTTTATPSIQYEDLGVTLEAKPHIDKDGTVSLHLHETVRSLAGSSLNGIPVIANQDVVSDLSVPSGETTVVMSNLSRTESGTIQGLTSVFPTDTSRDQQFFELVITLTPRLTRAVRISP